MDSIGEQVKAARKRVRMSQDHLARQTGMVKVTIGNIELGHTKHPSIDALIKLIWVLKVPFFFEYGGKKFVIAENRMLQERFQDET